MKNNCFIVILNQILKKKLIFVSQSKILFDIKFY